MSFASQRHTMFNSNCPPFWNEIQEYFAGLLVRLCQLRRK